MIEVLLVLAIVLTNVCVSLISARHWYGKWRIEEAEKRAGIRPYKANEVAWGDDRVAWLAAFTGLFWWVTLPVFAVRWLIMSDPPLAPHEKAAEQARRQADVIRMEIENEVHQPELEE